MSGHEVRITWRGRKVAAWIPDRLGRRELTLTEKTVRRTEQAAAAARRGSDQLPARWEPLARLLLRSEGLASSFIEGVRAPLPEVARAELDPDVGEAAAWVADNLAAVASAVADAQAPITVASLHDWHRALMTRASHLPPKLIGAFRNEQGWIGGTSPLDAALVTPPPGRVAALVDDLVSFVNREDLDAVTQAAIAHAQFEVIHPYADGNGRVGRILVAAVLARRLQLVTPPAVSVKMAADRGGYLAGLTQYRLGAVDPWVRWFADVVHDAGDATVNVVREIEGLQDRWSERLSGTRVDAAARRVAALLPEYPVVNASVVATTLSISERAARAALEDLAQHEIVQPFAVATRGAGRPRNWWVAGELVDLVGAWSR